MACSGMGGCGVRGSGVVGAAELAFAGLFVPLWKEYGWRIYKQIGADRDLKRRYLHYQIYVALLSESRPVPRDAIPFPACAAHLTPHPSRSVTRAEFDFFVFCAYCLQLILIVLQRMDAE